MSESVAGSSRPQRGPTRRAALILAALMAVGAWVLDQGTKLWVERTLELHEQVEVLPPVLYWRHHLNPGAAFSMGTDHTWFFTLIMTAVLIFVIWHSRKLGGSWPWTLGLGGLAGGVAGNLTDRLFRPMHPADGGEHVFGLGAVVDFIAVPNFAVMNVADIFITCSMIGMCLLMLTGRNIDGSREGRESEPADAEEDSAG
ncbi:signal peptidase II [Nesterenkonia cremea]|uniref:Lipoprotein signal peptidase n=1 Tax=Nesterenkonia cremea TaxID=1882340 RepID=A0A917AMT6_9MICC|nr:signal peptidase II [Nesterenkonia cremea]GGE61788.1 lipoprotein signal peptidase [Nesterenkonia cremea]